MTQHLIRLFFVFSLTVASFAASSENRVALVIGNSDYMHTGRLKNPLNDAEQISELLRGLNFNVIEGYDQAQSDFTKILAEFTSALKDADVALFYFAGHGIQLEGQNYLLSTNAKLESSFTLFGETIPLEEIIRLMESSASLNLAFIDACRNNPFLEKVRSSLPASRSTSVHRGLAPIARAQPDTLIMYATSPNQIAEDGDGEHSPFANALLEHLDTPNAEISQITKRIIQDVRHSTNFTQSPEVLNAMAREFYFKRDVDSSEAIANAYERAKLLNTASSWRAFINDHPNGFFTTLAQSALIKVEASNKAFDPNADYAQIESHLAIGENERITIQRTLAALGYNIGATDGKFGPATREQIRGFQKEWQIEPTGYINHLTRAIIGSEEVQKAAGRAFDSAAGLIGRSAEDNLNLSIDEIKLVQIGLSSMGYYPESNSGVFNLATRAAIQTLQYKRGSVSDGYLTADLAKELIEKGRTNYAGLATYLNVREQYSADIDKRLKGITARFQKRGVTLTNYAYFRKSLYVAIKAYLDPREAQKFAEHLGGHLVVFSNKAERDFVDNLIRGDNRFFEIDDKWFQGPAVGYFQKTTARKSTSGWYSVTGEPIKHLAWFPGQPNEIRLAGKPGFATYSGELRNISDWKTRKRNLRFADNILGVHKAIGFIFEFPPEN